VPDIKLLIAIDASPEKVYPLVANGRGFFRWWAEDVTESGETVELDFFNRTTIYRLSLLRGDEFRSAEWRCLSGQEWEGTQLLFTLTSNKGNTLLRFIHADWKAETDYFTMCTATWEELLYRLKAAAEGKTPGPLLSAAGLAY
jgi:uncharacterized protein YndB with AHSA1/START domain